MKEYDKKKGILWTWQSSFDSISIKSPLGEVMTVGNNPTLDRSKLGTKRDILTDKEGVPLSVNITLSSTLMT